MNNDLANLDMSGQLLSRADIDFSALAQKKEKLISLIERTGRLIVAYSGGVDSSLLSYYAHLVLGAKAQIVIAVSPSLAKSELEAARAQAQLFSWQLSEIVTDEVDKPEYQRNDQMRCYFCKHTLFDTLSKIAKTLGIDNIAYGANLDDLKDFRPGQKAAREFNILSPLQEAQLGKEEIRFLAREGGLPSWDRPQAACLSSRFPTFQPVTIESLSQVEKAEDYLRTLGFKQLRVRHHNDLARIEIEQSELVRIFSEANIIANITNEFKKLGYKYVTVDLEGYRQGSANTFI
jgi:uncharacterized protein